MLERLFKEYHYYHETGSEDTGSLVIIDHSGDTILSGERVCILEEANSFEDAMNKAKAWDAQS